MFIASLMGVSLVFSDRTKAERSMATYLRKHLVQYYSTVPAEFEQYYRQENYHMATQVWNRFAYSIGLNSYNMCRIQDVKLDTDF